MSAEHGSAHRFSFFGKRVGGGLSGAKIPSRRAFFGGGRLEF
jgi:hypothetical protein